MARRSTTQAVRLIHVADYGGPYRGSFIPMVLAVFAAARARGWQVEAMFSPIAEGRPWLAEFESQDIPVAFLAPRPRAAAARALRARLDTTPGPKVIHTHFTHFDLAAARSVRNVPEARLVWHVHEYVPSLARRRLRRYVKFLAGRGEIDAALCVGRDGVRDLRRSHVLRGDRLLHMPNAIDLAAFPLVDLTSKQAAKSALGLPVDTPVVLHFGRDWQLKGGDLFLRAIARLQAEGRRVTGVTVGAGDDARAAIAALGVEGVVRIQPFSDHVQQLYAAADVFVSCSRYEGDPFAILEALGSGLGVVVAADDQLDSHDVPTRRIVPFDPEAVADGIRELLDRSPDAAAADTEVTRDWAERTIALPAYADRVLAVYERILAGLPPGGGD